MYICIYIDSQKEVLIVHNYVYTSMTLRHCKHIIKTHDSDLRGQEEAGRMRQKSELFTCSSYHSEIC